jgi:acyl-CoA thioesterase
MDGKPSNIDSNIDIEAIRAFFAADRFAASAGIHIDEVSETGVTCSLELTAEHRNASGGVQGGAIFTLADLAFAVHANRGLALGAADGVTVGQSCSISFLKATRGKRLTARSTCLSRGKTMSVYRVTIEDDLGAPIAEFTGNGFTTRTEAAAKLPQTTSSMPH